MFFAPTILALTSEVELHSLCLSVGDADGLGQLRRDELESSLDVLGVRKGRRRVVDTPNLQDNFTRIWNSEDIIAEVAPYVFEYDIDTILTFDGQGISSHPNHISLMHGVSRMLDIQTLKSPLKAYSLITVPLAHKYIGTFAPLLAKLDIGFAQLLGILGLVDGGGMPVPVFVSGISEYLTALKAMRKHESQLVWFRWLYVSFSRYMWVNEWVEIPASGVE